MDRPIPKSIVVFSLIFGIAHCAATYWAAGRAMGSIFGALGVPSTPEEKAYVLAVYVLSFPMRLCPGRFFDALPEWAPFVLNSLIWSVVVGLAATAGWCLVRRRDCLARP